MSFLALQATTPDSDTDTKFLLSSKSGLDLDSVSDSF